jgi:hypothetical protein
MAKAAKNQINEAAENEEKVVRTEPEIIIMQPPAKPKEEEEVAGRTVEERMLNFVKRVGGSGLVNDFFRIEYKMLAGQPQTAKTVKGMLSGLVAAGKISVEGNAHLNLGKFYYAAGNPETQYHTLINTRLMITLL